LQNPVFVWSSGDHTKTTFGINSITKEVIAKPLEILHVNAAVTEKLGSYAHVHGNVRGFAITSCKQGCSDTRLSGVTPHNGQRRVKASA